MNDTEARQTKIIVALFLILGKAYPQLGAQSRQRVTVTESEIREAWKSQKSPVRLISRVRDGRLGLFAEGEQWGGEREFHVELGELDMNKTGMKFAGTKMPEEPKVNTTAPKGRCFDLE